MLLFKMPLVAVGIFKLAQYFRICSYYAWWCKFGAKAIAGMKFGQKEERLDKESCATDE